MEIESAPGLLTPQVAEARRGREAARHQGASRYSPLSCSTWTAQTARVAAALVEELRAWVADQLSPHRQARRHFASPTTCRKRGPEKIMAGDCCGPLRAVRRSRRTYRHSKIRPFLEQLRGAAAGRRARRLRRRGMHRRGRRGSKRRRFATRKAVATKKRRPPQERAVATKKGGAPGKRRRSRKGVKRSKSRPQKPRGKK